MDEQRRRDHFALQRIRVVELEGSIGASYAVRLLVDAGAEAIKVTRNGTHRYGSKEDSHQRRGNRCLLLDEYLDRGKKLGEIDPEVGAEQATLRTLTAEADVLVDGGGWLQDGSAAGQIMAEEGPDGRNASLLLASLTPFGRHGPASDYRGDDLMLVSASGTAAATPGYPDGVTDESSPPLRTDCELGEMVTGVVLAGGIMAGLVGRIRGRGARRIDVVGCEALAATGIWDQIMYAYEGRVPGRFQDETRRVPNHYLPLRDGWAVVVAYLDHHWRALTEFMGRAELADDPRFQTMENRSENWGELREILTAWLATKSRWQFMVGAQERGIPCAAVLSLNEAMYNEHQTERKFLAQWTKSISDSPTVIPGDIHVINGERRSPCLENPLPIRAYDIANEWSQREGDPVPKRKGIDCPHDLPLQGIRIMDFGQMIAGPLASQWLASLGAEVILVESRRRPGLRGVPPFSGPPESMNASGVFNSVNRGKKSCTLNLKSGVGVRLAKELVSTADIVLENFTPGTMSKLGLNYEELKAVNPTVIMVSLSSCGSSGPWRRFSALHSGVICLSGIADITGYEGGRPRLISSLFPDPFAGLHCLLASLYALYHRERYGEGAHIELAMTEILQTLMPERLMEASLGQSVKRVGSAHSCKAPHGIYRAGGTDEWVAVSVESDDEWEKLCKAMGRLGLASDARFAGRSARLDARGEIDGLVEEWTKDRSANRVAEDLQRSGVRAFPVLDAGDLFEMSGMRAEGAVATDRHPVAGEHEVLVSPWRLDGSRLPEQRHAPLIGDGNVDLFTGELGLGPAEVRRLASDGVIY